MTTNYEKNEVFQQTQILQTEYLEDKKEEILIKIEHIDQQNRIQQEILEQKKKNIDILKREISLKERDINMLKENKKQTNRLINKVDDEYVESSYKKKQVQKSLKICSKEIHELEVFSSAWLQKQKLIYEDSQKQIKKGQDDILSTIINVRRKRDMNKKKELQI